MLGGPWPRDYVFGVSYRVAVAASGRGSNLGALLTRLEAGGPAEVILVISNRPEASALATARTNGIPTAVFTQPEDTQAWLAVLSVHRVDLLVLAGYLKLLPPEVVRAYQGRIINIHPALLPRYGGPGMYGARVHHAVLQAGEKETGATVHLVTEQYDQGQVLAQARLRVRAQDTPESLAERVLELEHRLLPEAVLAAAAAGRPVPFPFTEEAPS